MNRAKAEILVMGAGIIGLTLAHELSLRGVRVTLIDQFNPGDGCSHANAGWLTPCMALPLPMPGQFWQSFKWLADPASPLHIKPQASWRLARWLTRFLRCMNHRTANASVRALTELSCFSLDAYETFAKHADSPFALHKKGLLMIAQSRKTEQAMLRQMQLMKQYGIEGTCLNFTEVQQLEPALTGNFMSGVHYPNEAYAEPMEVVQAFANAASAQGVEIMSGTEVFDFVTANGKVLAVRTTRGVLEAEQFVLATGSWSCALGKKLNLSVPVLGGKGYAFRVKSTRKNPQIPVMIADRKVAITPWKQGIRIAGTLEIVDQDFTINPRRLAAVLQGAMSCLDIAENPEIVEIWRGLRPCTPDGVPVIDFSRTYKNLFICTGHQMLGLQSAPGSARLAADLLTGSTPGFDPHPFRATRF